MDSTSETKRKVVDIPFVAPTSGARVLVAEDNPETREDLDRLLSRHWDVKLVADGRAALAAAREWSPHLVLADVKMPGLDGFALLSALRAEPATRTIPIVLMSALGDEHSRVEGFEAGADDYLTKPWSARELVARIGASLKLAQARIEAEKRSRDSETRLRLAAEAAELGVFEWYPKDDRIIWENNRMYEILGRNPEDGPITVAMFLDEVVHPDDAASFEAAIKGAMDSGRFLYSGRFRRGDGAERWIEFTGQIEHDANGKPIRMPGVAADITERKRRARQLEQRTDELEEAYYRLEMAAGAGAVGLWTWRVDDGTVTADEYLARVYGIDPETALAGAPIDSFFEPVHEADRARVRRDLEYAFEQSGELSTEFRVRDQAGHITWVLSRGKVQYDAARRPLRVTGAIADITERKEHEARDRFSLRLSDTLRQLSDPIEIQSAASRLLGEHLNTERTYYGVIDAGRDVITIERDYVRGDVPSIVGEYPIAMFPVFNDPVEAERLHAIDNVQTSRLVPTSQRAAFTALAVGSFMCAPILKHGKPLAVMAVTNTGTRSWTAHEKAQLKDVAERTWEAVERARTEEALRKNQLKLEAQNAVLEGINRIFREALTSQTEAELVRVCLAVAEDVTGSAFSFMTEIDQRTGRLQDLALSDRTRAVFFRDDATWMEKAPPMGFEIHGIYGRVIQDAKGLFTNDPPAHPDSIGTPGGHPPLTAFLGVPLFDHGDAVGMIGFGNREDGYRPQDLEAAEALAPAIMQALISKRTEARLARTEARQRFLIAFGDVMRVLVVPDEIMRIAAERLANHLGADRAAYGDIDNRGEFLMITDDWHAEGAASLTGRHPLTQELREGSTCAIDDADNVTDAEFAVALKLEGFCAGIAVPLVKRGRLIAALLVESRTPRRWTTAEVGLVTEVAERTWEAIKRARADEALRASEERHKLADRRKDEFLATLSHELRNPLAPLRNSLEILRRNRDRDEEANPVIQIMDRQVKHMGRLVEDLLDVSRITRGQIELKRELVNVQEVLESAIEASMPPIEAGGHRLHLDLPPERLILNGDPVRLGQVFANLINNAAKYMDDDGDIWVTATRDGRRIRITVKDSGFGIAPRALPYIFDMYSRAIRTERQTRNLDGLGIGLTLVRRLTELHGGRVDARSQGAGAGSEFTVELPLAERKMVASASRSETPGISEELPILVVDDNADAADSLAILLNLEGASARAVYDGAAALNEIKEHKPAVALIDIGMPQMNGFELAERIRRQPEYDNVTLIALTGWGQTRHRRRSKAAGFDHHVTKPPDLETLKPLLQAGASNVRQRAVGD